jgi:ABC-type phosphate/phosphonate transport system substrate-binding protein
MRFAAMMLLLAAGWSAPAAEPALTVVVMDPLAAPLSCPCVKGYAQRDYDKLGEYLQKRLGRPVKVAYSESLPSALKAKTDGKADLVIGKYSVVVHDAKKTGLKFTDVAALTGKDGKTTQTGLVVVLNEDPARSVEDLRGYTILYGDVEAEEKHGAVMKMLRGHRFVIPDKPLTCAACDEGATRLMDMGKKGEKGAAVISSYAKPLLEGCGTVPKGALRVVAETEPVPFVVAFANDGLGADVRDAVTKALIEIKDDPALCQALETRNGFVEAGKKK